MSTLTLVEPKYLWVPEHATGTYGDEAADLAELYGRPLDPEQRLAVDAAMSHDARGNWVALETCRVEPRQNGKTSGEVTAVVFADLFLFDADKISWSAHLFKTTREAFDDHKALIAGCSELSRRVKKITEANGEEAIELHGGAKLQYLARSKGGGRGLGGKRVVMDEALFLTTAKVGALMPTLSARPNPQISYASSSGLLESTQLRSLRNRGRKGGDPSLVYVEHCADDPTCEAEECSHRVGVAGCSFDDEARWRQANHAMERGRITLAYVAAERRAMESDPDQFGTERLGYWQDPPAEGAELDVEQWNALADPQAAPHDPLVLALDVSPKMASAAIMAVGGAGDDPALPVAEIPTGAHRKGTHWVVDRLVELRKHGTPDVVLDPASPAGALIPQLIAAGIEPVLLSGREVVQACGGLLVAIADEQLRHRGDPILTAAVMGARRRAVGDSFKWTRVNSTVDISPVAALTWALHHWTATRDGDYDVADSIL